MYVYVFVCVIWIDHFMLSYQKDPHSNAYINTYTHTTLQSGYAIDAIDGRSTGDPCWITLPEMPRATD